MKKIDLIDGKCYVIIQNNTTSTKWIIKAQLEGISEINGKCINDGHLYTGSSWGNWGDVKSIRKATIQETNHLKACIKAKRFVAPLEIIEDNYTMY